MSLSSPSRSELPVFVVCPSCRGELRTMEDEVQCPSGHRFPLISGVVDFLPGVDAADAAWAMGRSAAEQACAHAAETDNLDHRIDNYLLPFIDARFADRRAIRLLDDGTGLGHTVRLMTDRGVNAFGIDPGHRREEWMGSGLENRLFSASGTALPFADESFDIVLSSGVLEHVGEHLPEGHRDGPCEKYIHEILRVLQPGGAALVAAPNGLHPIDYWHTNGRAMRIHSPFEQWMPRPREMRAWVRSSPVAGRIRFLSPQGYLAFQTIRRHAYGRAFSGAMKGLFAVMHRHPALSSSPLNPWLVGLVERAPGAESPR